MWRLRGSSESEIGLDGLEKRVVLVIDELHPEDDAELGPGPGGDRLLSLTLFRALEACLARREQAILFLNRRGFSTFVLCTACGNAARCGQCSSATRVRSTRRTA